MHHTADRRPAEPPPDPTRTAGHLDSKVSVALLVGVLRNPDSCPQAGTPSRPERNERYTLMRRHRRLTAALTGAALLLPPLAACGIGGGGDELVIYSGRGESLVKPLLDQLEDETGMDVTVRYGKTAELAAQLAEEGDRTDADLFLAQDSGALGALSKEGLLASLPQATLDAVDPAFRGGDGDWTGLSGRARVIVYDPAQVEESELPSSVHDLTDPKWRGQVGYAPTNASFQSFVTAMRVLEGEEAAAQWLTGIQDNGARAYENNVAILEAADAGEVSLGLINHYYWFRKVEEKGLDNVNARLHYLPGGDSGSLVNVAGVGVSEHSDHAEAALKAVEFLLSDEAQTYFATETKEYPLAAGVTSPVADLPPLESLETPELDLGDLDSLEQTLELLRETGMI